MSRETFQVLSGSGLRWRSLGTLTYPESEALQRRLARARQLGQIRDTLLCLEHPHTYTLGRSASADDILIGEQQQQQKGVSVFRSDRGGKVTYHGPGQLVGYLICDLRERRLSVPQFVWLVEEAIRYCLHDFRLAAERRPGSPGLWVGGRKIAALGFHISRGISRHGFAINVSTDLSYYDWIVPCGKRLPVSSLSTELETDIPLSDVRTKIVAAVDQVFSVPFKSGKSGKSGTSGVSSVASGSTGGGSSVLSVSSS